MKNPLQNIRILYCFFSNWRWLITGFCLFAFVPLLSAQKQNNVWIFGKNAGLDFNYTPPRALDSMPVRFDDSYFNYVSSICDTSGKLLLYTDGLTVWNQHIKPIAKYQQRWPWSAYCMPLLVPYPNNDSLFYLFCVSAGPYAYQLQYLTINATSDFGYGKIIYPQPSTLDNYFTVLKDDASVMVAGTAHCNRKDTWIVTHSQDAFYAYLVTANGVSSTPVISPIPDNVVPKGKYEEGNIKFSASGEKLIMPIMHPSSVAVFAFDNNTGVFSNGYKLALPADIQLEDAELSPDGSKLYFGGDSTGWVSDDMTNEFHSIQQWNLEAGSPAQIENSRYNLTSLPDRVGCGARVCYIINRTLQLAPDGKIYVSQQYLVGPGPKLETHAGAIEAPNEPGIESNYKPLAVDLKKLYHYINYNYIRSSAYTIKENGVQYKKENCQDQPVKFSLLINKTDSVFWNFGDERSGANNISTMVRPSHTYPAAGTYRIRAIIYYRCAVDTAFADIVIGSEKAIKLSPTIHDTVLCTGNILLADATTQGASSYLWSNGFFKPIQSLSQEGEYSVKVMNDCSVDERTFSFKYQKCECQVYLPKAFSPNRDQLNDVFRPIVKCALKNYRFQIFDRFGKVIYISERPGEGWNGKVNDMDISSGTYAWLLTYTDPNTKRVEKKFGNVMLVR